MSFQLSLPEELQLSRHAATIAVKRTIFRTIFSAACCVG
jgi:hypothetical protein